MGKIITFILLVIISIPIIGSFYFLYAIIEGEDTTFLSFFILGILYFLFSYLVLFVWLLKLIYKKLYFKQRIGQYLSIIVLCILIILIPVIFLDHNI